MKKLIIAIVSIVLVLTAVGAVYFILTPEEEVDTDYHVEEDTEESKFVVFSNWDVPLTSGTTSNSVGFLAPYEPEKNYSDSVSALFQMKLKTGNSVYLFAKGGNDDNLMYTMSAEDILALTSEARSSLSMFSFDVNENTQFSKDYQSVDVDDNDMTAFKTQSTLKDTNGNDFNYVDYLITKKYSNLGINAGLEFMMISDEASVDEMNSALLEIIDTVDDR